MQWLVNVAWPNHFTVWLQLAMKLENNIGAKLSFINNGYWMRVKAWTRLHETHHCSSSNRPEHLHYSLWWQCLQWASGRAAHGVYSSSPALGKLEGFHTEDKNVIEPWHSLLRVEALWWSTTWMWRRETTGCSGTPLLMLCMGTFWS